MRTSLSYNMLLCKVIFSLAMCVCSHALVLADEQDAEIPFHGDFPNVSLSLEEASGTQPSGESNALSFGNDIAFDWKAWAIVGIAGAVLVGVRLFNRRTEFKIPSDVFELLGESTLGNGQAVRIIRFGPKTLLVSVGSGGPKTLSELDDPLATEWIAAACRGEQTLRSSASRLSVDNNSKDPSGSQEVDSGRKQNMTSSASVTHSEVA
jgi:flagellar biogenesis protein FliO